MATATAITGALGFAGGAAKFFQGRKMQKDAEKFIKNFQWQDLENPYETLSVSTLGADLRREEAGRMSATSIDALQSGGTRALVGGIGKVQANNNITNREIAANLDEQQKRIDYAKAGQDVVNQNMIESRQANELAGYGQMMNVGMGMKYGGITDAINGIGAGAQGLSGLQSGVPQVSSQGGMSMINGMPPMTQGNASLYYGNQGMS